MTSNGDATEWTLKDYFDAGLRLYDEVQSFDGSSSDKACQDKVGAAIGYLERATRMVNDLALFSDNEDASEISTTSLRYLLLPCLLGALESKRMGVENRLDVLRKTRAYVMDFLHRCRDYGFRLTDRSILDLEGESGNQVASASSLIRPDLSQLSLDRQAKIERYQKMKERKELLAQMDETLKKRLGDDYEETERRYFMLRIQDDVEWAIDEIKSIRQEMGLLEHRERMRYGEIRDDERRRQGGSVAEKEERTRHGPVLILSRKDVRAKVFGAGYPSLPTMTVEEFYEKEYGGKVAQGGQGPEKEKEEEEKEESDDDEAKVQSAREWDEFKDTHRRGWGNRQNRL
ncbi:immunoglobulin-binding protein 1-like [Oscarella lobularis]|uniref:immunoglobulin-binding protein 1-like n=1 Tax=Oscarella lobularis TaxID=121494 RepID=UPI003313F261